MKWERMAKPLREGMQVFRVSWPEDQYVMTEFAMVENERPVLLFTGEHPEGVPFEPTGADVAAEDWAATGPSGM